MSPVILIIALFSASICFYLLIRQIKKDNSKDKNFDDIVFDSYLKNQVVINKILNDL